MNLLLSGAFVLCWSSGFIGAKLGAGSAGAVTVLMWRFLPLALVLVLVALLLDRAPWRGLRPRDGGRQVLIGALSQSGYLLTVYYAIQLGVSSGTTALIDGTQPLVAGALAGPLLRQYVTARQWLGLCLGLAGVAVVTTADASAAAGVVWWAYLVPFAGMLSLVAATMLESRSRHRVEPRVALTVHCATSAAVFTGLAVVTGAAVPPAEPSFWLAVGWLVVLSTFGGYGLYWLVLRRSGVMRVNTLMFLMAPVTAVWGALMFGEPFGPQTAIGLAIGLAAVAVVHRTGGARRSGTGRPVSEDGLRTLGGRGGGGSGGGVWFPPGGTARVRVRLSRRRAAVSRCPGSPWPTSGRSAGTPSARGRRGT
ncbi:MULTISPECIES: DMT family transporter [Streptomyces]|uniref:DMT family transporter n=1 Tax=Streptomyces lycii TaxID=2654337 RepID=A0ABQ7FJ39_9ACTN|nr:MULTISPECIES: DMT family transporter [Streptomyces]KAF4408991.1 DMT family transporter [Streptomyces lycii]PGH47993.1 EamA family transporter [Streptomyces sp. Ru87]